MAIIPGIVGRRGRDVCWTKGDVPHATDFTNGNNALFNVLAPATVKDEVPVGAGYDITPNWTLEERG
jgi:hypothetical protein